MGHGRCYNGLNNGTWSCIVLKLSDHVIFKTFRSKTDYPKIVYSITSDGRVVFGMKYRRVSVRKYEQFIAFKVSASLSLVDKNVTFFRLGFTSHQYCDGYMSQLYWRWKNSEWYFLYIILFRHIFLNLKVIIIIMITNGVVHYLYC